MAAPYRSRDGLSTRPGAYAGSSDEIQLRIDPMHADFDEEVSGLRKQVRKLRDVAQEIETEAKFQNDFLNQLQMTLIKAQAGVKNNMRRLNKSIIREGSSHVMHVLVNTYGWFLSLVSRVSPYRHTACLLAKLEPRTERCKKGESIRGSPAL
ncbi:Bet1-like protein [Sesamum alatum]|uniref:Bet1-like protein n=1 Tax=Sesamum alatum TaxID=300844 RepID=A0AAE2CM13_9LAMI|nr:Bet1-like protein [Sesamum alatum]